MRIQKEIGGTIIAPSLFAAPADELGAALEAVERGGAQFVHIDIMDGHFVPNLSFGSHVVAGLRRRSRLHFDVHLMIERPAIYVQSFIDAGADCITVHPETVDDFDSLAERCNDAHVGFGLALHPKAPLEDLLTRLPACDLLLIMGVVPGFGGQAFIPETIDRIRAACAARSAMGADFLVSVDGGINETTGRECVRAGADVLVSGSSVFSCPNPEMAVRALKGRLAS